MTNQKDFLKLNGNAIIFLSVDGTYWIALKPICEALKVDYVRSFKNVKNDSILGAVLSKQTIQVSNNGVFQGRKMTCIPEKYIYGWLFSLRSESPELTEYKRTCYELLYNHFHGSITNRKELLVEKSDVLKEIRETENELQQNKVSQKLESLKARRKKLSFDLLKIDKDLVTQTNLFEITHSKN